MKIEYSISLIMFGSIIGYYVPLFAQKIITYKYSKGNGLSAQLLWMPKFGIVTCILNATGWGMVAYFSYSSFIALLFDLLLTLAILIAVVDLRVHKIPNETVFGVMVLGSAFQLFSNGGKGLLYGGLSMLAVMACFTLLAGAMGFRSVGAGDIKLAGAMGLTLSYPYILHGLIVMSLLMAFYCTVGIIFKKLTLKSMLPFAPFMMAGMSYALIIILNSHLLFLSCQSYIS